MLFTSKPTRAEKEARLGYLQTARRRLDEDPMIIAWKDFLRFPSSKKRIAYQAWENYYTSVEKTLSYEIFQEQKKATAEEDWGRVKELADQIRSMRANGELEYLPMPQTIDPFELENGPMIRSYLSIEREIKKITGYPEV